MPRIRDYYRQFSELPPEEVSLRLRARRDEEKRRALARVDPLDLSGTAWHQPPHPEAVNAATFALRRALNAYPDAAGGQAREAVAARHGLAPEHVALGHGAGELLRSLLAAVLEPGDTAIVAWPGWQPLPGLVEVTGGRPVPMRSTPASLLEGAAGGARAVVVTSPGDPDGVVCSRGALRTLREALPEPALLIVDEALGEFCPGGEDAAGLVGELPGLVVVRSFSKAHAMAGLRAGAALGPPELIARIAPSGGLGAPAQAAVTWAAGDRGGELARGRRAAAADAHRRLAAALAGSPLAAAPATVPFAWISSDAEDGPAIAARLAAQQVYVAPGRLWGDERHVRAALGGGAAVDRLAAALLDGVAG
jgi:histidinol-phosphate/aromatic aminotransferase/cobyric acid decarboxylase-like protein